MRRPLAAFRVLGFVLVLVLAVVGVGLLNAAALTDLSDDHDYALSAPDAFDRVDLLPAAAEAAPVSADPPGTMRLAHPAVVLGPRRVGIQAGHWLTQEAPAELGRIVYQTGTSWAGITEVSINLDIAQRVAEILGSKGVIVDVLPTTIPPGYLADAFVALHGDGDGTGAKSGFKSAHSTRRTPYEDRFQEIVNQEYGAATGLDYDSEGISRAMLNYYAMAWSRIQHSTSPFTPSIILEMGFVSNDWDRSLMVNRADLVAGAVSTAVLKFLDEHPRTLLHGSDLVVPLPPPRPPFRPPQ